MARRVSPDLSIGERIKTKRLLRDWSIRYAADRAGIADSTWSRIERGLLSADNRYVLAAIADALECPVTDLTGIPTPPDDRATIAAQTSVHAILRALVDIDPTEPTDHPCRPLPELKREAELLRDLWARCEYASASQRVPGLLRELHAAAAGPDRQQALRLLCDATYTASSIVRHLGHPAEAWLGAERCRAAAETLDDPVLIGLAAVAHVQAAASCGSYGRSLTIASRAADELHRHTGSPGSLEVAGTLHLASANACRALKRADDSAGWITEATDLARHTGDTVSLWLWFGPTNVNLWRIGIEIDGGDPARAVRIARDTRPEQIPAPMRQVAFHVDLARALSRTRQHDKAVQHLLVAERQAPQYVHSSSLAQETSRGLLERARRAAGGPALRGLCERMGVAV